MVGSDRDHVARSEGFPEVFVLLCVTKRRRHDVLGAFEVGPFGIGLVEYEMGRHRLDEDVDAAISGLHGLLHCGAAGGVHDVDMGSGQFGKGAQMTDSVCLHAPRPRWLVPLRPGLSIGDQLLLHRIDRLGILAVGGDDDTEFPGNLHEFKKLLVGDIEGTLVGKEDLETRDAVIGNQVTDLLLGDIIEPHHREMKGEIAAGPRFRESLPLIKRGAWLIVRAGTDHLDHRRRAASERRLGCRGVVVDGVRSHERQMNVHVRINETRKDVLAAGINDFCARTIRRINDIGHLGDCLPLNQNIRLSICVRSNHPAILDEY